MLDILSVLLRELTFYRPMSWITLERQDCSCSHSVIDGQEGYLERIVVAEECLDELHGFYPSAEFYFGQG